MYFVFSLKTLPALNNLVTNDRWKFVCFCELFHLVKNVTLKPSLGSALVENNGRKIILHYACFKAPFSSKLSSWQVCLYKYPFQSSVVCFKIRGEFSATSEGFAQNVVTAVVVYITSRPVEHQSMNSRTSHRRNLKFSKSMFC